MKRSFSVEFWNFVCHFGESKLLDFYIELVHPAFFNKGLVREYGETSWFFHDTKLLICDIDGDNLPFIYGKIVKDYELQRDQIFQDDELIADPLSIQNSPSSIFILSLFDHRMFFIKEHQDSPTMDSFKSTIEKFINTVRVDKINEEYDYHELLRKEHGQLKRKTKKSLGVAYPKPDIEIIPLASDAGIEEFIRDLKRIDLLQLDLVMPNSEGDSNDFFSQWRKEKKKLGDSKSSTTFRKGKSKTLPHGAIAELAKEAARDENILFKIKGKDQQDDDVTGTAESFKLKRNLSEIQQSPTLLAKATYEIFKNLIADGIIRGPRISDGTKVKEKIKHIMTMLGKN